MERTLRTGRIEHCLSRRVLLSRGIKSIVAWEWAPFCWWPRANNANRSASDARGLGDIIFERTIIDLPFGDQVRECFVVDGKLSVNRSCIMYGAVTVGFTDQTTASVRIVNNRFSSSYRGFTIIVRPDSDHVRVNQSLRPLSSLVVQLIQENDFTGIGPLSPQSRALVALGALANTNRFMSSLTAADGPKERMLARMCRLTPAPTEEIAWWSRRSPLLITEPRAAGLAR